MARVPVHGVLLLDKPLGLSSNAALVRCRRALNALKAGHTGTLDPLATGLLPLCFGEATKFAADLLDADKAYRASVRLGATTTTGDAEGEVLVTAAVDVSAAQLATVLANFRGEIDQIPPMYSALKREGKPLYAYAREGITVERAPRRVTIKKLLAVRHEGDTLEIEVDCSKGTYIRTLAEDIGKALGCGAHLIALERTRVGDLSLADAVSLVQFEQETAEAQRARLLPPDALIQGLAVVTLESPEAHRFSQGQRLRIACEAQAPCRVRVYAASGALLGLADLDPDGRLAPYRLLAV